jgi:hypothetical protein
MISSFLKNVVVLLLIGVSSVASSQDLVTNGSFESGLTGWSWGQANEAGGSGACSYNAATAPGTETLTITPGFPATDGTEIVLGSVSSTSGTASRTNCTLYQDIAVPANTTTLVLKYDIGAKNGNDGCLNTGAFVGLYSPASIPTLASPQVAGSRTQYCTAVPSATLSTFTIVKTVTAVAGTTIRLAFINAANMAGHEVIGIDNVSFVTQPPTVTLVTPASGPAGGGTSVTITGTNFGGTTSVTFGGAAATTFSVVDGTTITATVPTGSPGTASVIVTTPSGSNAANALYTYIAAPAAIPTLSEWGMLILSSLLALCAFFTFRRQRS